MALFGPAAVGAAAKIGGEIYHGRKEERERRTQREQDLYDCLTPEQKLEYLLKEKENGRLAQERRDLRRKRTRRSIGAASLLLSGTLAAGVSALGNIAESNQGGVTATESESSTITKMYPIPDTSVMGFDTVVSNPGAIHNQPRAKIGPFEREDKICELRYNSLTVQTEMIYKTPDLSEFTIDEDAKTARVNVPHGNLYTKQHIDPTALKQYSTDCDWRGDLGNAINDVKRSFGSIDDQEGSNSISREDTQNGALVSFVELDTVNRAARECSEEIKRGDALPYLFSEMEKKVIELNDDLEGYDIEFSLESQPSADYAILPYTTSRDISQVSADELGITVDVSGLDTAANTCELSDNLQQHMRGDDHGQN